MIGYLLCFLAGGAAGFVAAWSFAGFSDRRLPSSERVFERMWRRARRMRLRAVELDGVWSAIDLSGDRLLPLLWEVHREELTLEQSTEALDRLRAKLRRLEAGDPRLPEQVWGWRRSITNRRALPELDARTRLPGIVQVGDHATPEAETDEARAAAVQRERIESERLVNAARDAAQKPA